MKANIRNFVAGAAVLATIFGATSAKAAVVINEVFGAGGSAGAPYVQDYVELYNNGASPVTMTDWSVQYASATGLFGQATLLFGFSGTIAPGGYYLIGLATGTTVTTPLPVTPDANLTASTTPNLSGSNGKILLANSTLPVANVTNPADASIVDLLGYGTANFFEGAAAAPALTATSSLNRTGGVDTNNNSADFTSSSTPTPTNAAGSAVSDWSIY